MEQMKSSAVSSERARKNGGYNSVRSKISQLGQAARTWLSNACFNSSVRHREPLLKYVVFHLEDEENMPLSVSKRRIIFFTIAVLMSVALIPISSPLIDRFFPDRNAFYISSHYHSILEVFCGAISLIIGFILSWEYAASGKRSVIFLVFAFFSMGIFDIFHAFANYCHNLFVWFHSLSAFFGAAFFSGSILFARVEASSGQTVWTRRLYLFAGTFLILTFALLSMELYSHLPDVLKMKLPHHTSVVLVKGHFSSFIYIFNFVSCVLYLFSGVVFVRGFLKTNDIIYLIFGASALLFFESELSFTFSKLWDSMWWFWHVIKAVVSSGLLLGLAYGFTRTFYGLHNSKVKLANFLEEIERKNTELTEAYKRLKETQKYLSESEKLASIGEMAAGLAHEIKNPLGAITNSLGVLKKYSSLEGDDVELVAIVESEMERMNKLVEDFLSFARPSRLNRTETDLHSLIDETLSLLGMNRENLAGIEINKDFDPGVPRLMLDRNCIKQILLNLFINAVQAMPGGGIITVKTKYKAEEREVELAVADTGAGMSEEILSQVFKPFFTTKDKGLGIGLNIVHKIVKEHGGYILISSKEGEGTRIQLNFSETVQENHADAPPLTRGSLAGGD